MIQLENESGVYQPGDTISGRVVFNVEHQQTIKAFSLQISGYAATRWEIIVASKKKSKTGDDTRATETKIYSHREDYIASTLYFLGSEEAQPKIVNRGRCAYTFQTSLPERAVSSYEHPLFGHIRYELRAIIDYGQNVQTVQVREVTVRRPYDLRREGALMQHYGSEIVEKKSKLKFWQRPLMMFVVLPQNGYIAGEFIMAQVKILNGDQVKLHGITYKLNVCVSFWGCHKKSKSNVQLDRCNVAQIEYLLDGQKSSVVQHVQKIQVPANLTPTTELQHCKIIQISYELEVVLTCAQDRREIVAQMPLKIGTISLHDPAGGESRMSDSAGWASAPNLLVAQRCEKFDGEEEQNFEPTAPNEACADNLLYPNLSDVTSTPRSCNDDVENNTAISLNEADFMKPVQLNSKQNGFGSVDQLAFRPRYMFYKMEDT